MHFPSFTLLGRELRGTLRGWSLPILLSLGAMVLFIWTLALEGSSGAAGRGLILGAAKIQSAVITFVCAVMVTGAVAEEKEAGVIDLLLMTGMSPFSLLAGLTGSHVLTIALTLASMFPFMLLGATLGGTYSGQILAVLSVLCCHVLCSSGLAVWLALETRTHMMALAAFVFLAVGGPILLAAFGVEGALPAQVLDNLFARPSGYDFPWVWCLTVGLSGMAFFTLACLRFRTSVLNGGGLSALTNLIAPARKTRPEVGRQIWWKDWEFNYGGGRGIAARLGLMGLMVGLTAAGAGFRGADPDAVIGVIAIGLLSVSVAAFVLEILFHSARMYRMDSRIELQDDLRYMPMPVERIIAQKETAFLRAMAGSYFPVSLIGVFSLTYLDSILAFWLGVTLSLLTPLLWTLHLMIAERSLTRGWMAIPLSLGKLAGLAVMLTMVFFFIGGTTFGLGLVLIPVAYFYVLMSLNDAAHSGLTKEFLASPHTLWTGERYVRVRRKPPPHLRRVAPPEHREGG